MAEPASTLYRDRLRSTRESMAILGSVVEDVVVDKPDRKLTPLNLIEGITCDRCGSHEVSSLTGEVRIDGGARRFEIRCRRCHKLDWLTESVAPNSSADHAIEQQRLFERLNSRLFGK